MIASQLISDTIPPVKTSDTGKKAMRWMNELHVRHLPIVNNQQFLGLISEEDVLNFNDASEPIGGHSLSLKKPYVSEDDHLYDVIKVAVSNQLSLVPVIDYDGNYMGVITIEDLLRHFATTGSLADPGTILVLELNKRDYVLSEIARIVESENGAVLSTFVTSNPDSAVLEVTLKISSQSIKHIAATFERFGYTIKAAFEESDYMDNLKDRYDSLMNYLNV